MAPTTAGRCVREHSISLRQLARTHRLLALPACVSRLYVPACLHCLPVALADAAAAAVAAAAAAAAAAGGGLTLDVAADDSQPRYCLCQNVSYGEMVACDNPECPIEWFHFACVGLTEQPKGKWYCPECAPQFAAAHSHGGHGGHAGAQQQQQQVAAPPHKKAGKK